MPELPRQTYVVDLVGGVVGSVVVVAQNESQAAGMAASAAAEIADVPLQSIDLDGVYEMPQNLGTVMVRVDVTGRGLVGRWRRHA